MITLTPSPAVMCHSYYGIFPIVCSGYIIMSYFPCNDYLFFFYHYYFVPNIGGRHSGFIFGTQLEHPKITAIITCLDTNYTVMLLLSVMFVFSGCNSCVPKMWRWCSEDVKVVCLSACLQKMEIVSYLEGLNVQNVKFLITFEDSL